MKIGNVMSRDVQLIKPDDTIRSAAALIMTGAGGNFIGDVEWPSFGDVADRGSGAEFTTKAPPRL